ncbi:MAG: polysaccharide deacetylase family protein [Verrucomicrobiae bacterium]
MEKSRENKEVVRALVVSVHDVSPLTWRRTREILGDLEAVGIARVSLLVIPDHHRRGLISGDSEFAEWLRIECAKGREAVLHGYCHLRENRGNDGLWKRLVTRSYTAGEGEFFDLEKPAALDLLHRGRAAFASCGVSCTGFIAPAWLLGAAAEEAVREAGFEYTTRIATVSDFLAGRVHRARSQVWSVRSPWRRACSLAWNAVLFRATSESPLVRIGIHPPDWDHARIRRQILEFAGKALAVREAMTYEGWLTRVRGKPRSY